MLTSDLYSSSLFDRNLFFMDSFITYIIVLASISFGIGSLIEYIKQNIKTKSDKIQKAILIFTGVILSVGSTLLMYWKPINLLPKYISQNTEASVAVDILATAIIIYVGQFQVSMRLVKALIKKAVKNLLKKYNLESEEITNILESL